jgi:hypothetical protein
MCWIPPGEFFMGRQHELKTLHNAACIERLSEASSRRALDQKQQFHQKGGRQVGAPIARVRELG